MHVAVSWFHAIVQATPQVQVVESVKVHSVETVNVVTQDRESKSLHRMCRLAWVDVGGRSSTKTLKTLLSRKPGGQHGLRVVWCSRYK